MKNSDPLDDAALGYSVEFRLLVVPMRSDGRYSSRKPGPLHVARAGFLTTRIGHSETD